ncbi:MAG: MOSC domain-containing protein, partial [Deltaproteobacteria bacterium]|nr:MOSC domain-containing protein [Deltaproteobacteria bacterium]
PKECHSRCAIYYQAGDCIMPKEGIFAKVLKGGRISVGDGIGKSDAWS